MYFLSGEATCLNVTPACLVMSVNVILGGCWLRTDFSRSGATAQSKNITRTAKIVIGFRCAVALLREKLLIGPSIAPCLLPLSRCRVASRLQPCGPRRCMHDRADSEHAPDRAAS